MADNKNKDDEKKETSKEVAKKGEDFFNVVKAVEKAAPPKAS
jgi:hypothetical protein